MRKQAIIYCPECNGHGCAHCDYQGSWEGDWRCYSCDGLMPSEKAFCPRCEEHDMPAYAGEQAKWNEWQEDTRQRSEHLGKTLAAYQAKLDSWRAA